MLADDILAIHRPTAVLTAKGETVAAAYRFLQLFRALDQAERADVLELLSLELSERALD